MNKFKAFLTNSKKTITTVGAAGLIALVAVAGVVSADGPTFNIFPIAYDGSLNTDYPLLDGRNVTKAESWSVSQADHAAGINSDPNDIIEFLIYYHNGAATAPENIANSVIARATIPATAGSTHTIGASISAANAQTVSSSNHGGDVTVRVSGPLGQTLTLIPGSTVWLPNRASTQTTMPNTINTSGISLGNIEGCWQFAGFVKFQVRVSNQQPNYTLSVNKEVRKLSDAGFSDSVTISPGDTVEFRITATNTGTATINSVFIRDTLPSQLTFVPGTLTISQAPLSGDLFSSGANVGSVGSGASVTARFQAQAAASSSFPVGNTTLQNTGIVWGQAGSTAVPQVTDTATVIVNKPAPQLCTVSVRATFNGQAWPGFMNYLITGPTGISGNSVPTDFPNSTSGAYTPQYISGGPSSATFSGVTPTSANCPAGGSVTFTFNFTRVDVHNLTINKQVRNLTTGTGFADATEAQPSQTVQFQIQVTNIGNVDENNINLRDALPALLAYNANSLNVDGSTNYSSLSFFSSGINIGSLAVNQTRTIIFEATVAGQAQFPVGITPLINTGYTSSLNVTERNDTATVNVNKQALQKENGNPSVRP